MKDINLYFGTHDKKSAKVIARQSPCIFCDRTVFLSGNAHDPITGEVNEVTEKVKVVGWECFRDVAENMKETLQRHFQQ